MPFFPRFQHPNSATSSASIYPADLLSLLNEAASVAASPANNPSGSTSRRGFSPNFDVHENEREYILEGEVPGLSDKKSIALEFTDDQTLHISGKIERNLHKSIPASSGTAAITESGEEKKEQEKEEKKPERPKYWVSERSVGEFSRSFSFPGSINIDNVKATLEHGVLKIVVPKKEKPAGRKIEIH
ncbi:HSP20-like chaperone [Geopyxis carbonaria]|nr:HSP20-like chaperone [Geopyxis carbonaria]